MHISIPVILTALLATPIVATPQPTLTTAITPLPTHCDLEAGNCSTTSETIGALANKHGVMNEKGFWHDLCRYLYLCDH